MIEYRETDSADIAVIYDMSKQLIDQHEDRVMIDYEKVLRWVSAKVRNHIGEYQTILLDGEKAGYIRLHETDNMLELDDLYILEPFRNCGIGTAVLQDCIAQSENRQLSLFLYVFRGNTGAVALYERMGFQIIAHPSPTRHIMRRDPVSRNPTNVNDTGDGSLYRMQPAANTYKLTTQ